MENKGYFRTVLTASVVGSAALCALSLQAQNLAYDNASLYPSSNWPANNEGNGYNLWTAVGGISGGGTYIEKSGRQVDGSPSFALYAGGSTGSGSGYAISRPLANPITIGTFSVLTRFDLTGSGPNLINL